MTRLMICFGLVLGLILPLNRLPYSAFAQNDEEIEIDYVGLAGRLVREGDYKSAAENLKKAPASQKDTEAYQLVVALLDLYQERFESALTGLDKLIAGGSTDNYLWIYKAQAHYGTKQFREVIASLKKVSELAASIPTVAAMRLKALWELNEYELAWTELQKQTAKVGKTGPLVRLDLEWSLEKKLYERAKDLVLRELTGGKLKTDDKLDLIGILRGAGRERATLEALEIMRLTESSNPVIISRLAFMYAELQKYNSSAQLFHEAALLDPDYSYQAAEVYLKADKPAIAMRLNRKVKDQVKKFRQRLAILIAQGDYEKAAASEADLRRLGLLSSEDLRYALAFAFYKTRQFDRLDYHLSQIQKPDLFAKAIALRKEMIECQSSGDCA